MDPSELLAFFTLSSKSPSLFPTGLYSQDLISLDTMNVTLYRDKYEPLLHAHKYESFAVFPGLCVPISGAAALSFLIRDSLFHFHAVSHNVYVRRDVVGGVL